MTYKSKRGHYADYIIKAVREDSPWMLDLRGGLSLLLLRDLNVDGRKVKCGFSMEYRTSPSSNRSGRLNPMILIEDGSEWRVLDSLWTLGRIAGGTTASAFSQNPSLLLDPPTSIAIIRRVLARIRDIEVSNFKDLSEILNYLPESSVIGEKSEEEIKLALESISEYLKDREVSVFGRISILLGSWPVEEFRKRFSLSLEAVRMMEEEVQPLYDEIYQLARVDEFVCFRHDEFSLSGEDAEISQSVSLGWIFYSFERSSSGEGISKEYYNELGRAPLEHELSLEDAAGWKEIMVEYVKRILDDWLSKKKRILSEEPEIDVKSETLRRMLRTVLGEEYSLSGSLEGFF